MKSIGILLSVLALGSCGANASHAQRPNVIILFSDDAGYADFGFQPNCQAEMKSLTPHIDSIAKQGVRFSNAYVSGAVCSPSRAGLMTGRYQQRFGHETNIPAGYMKMGLPLEETFFVSRLRTQGFRTALVGKWHLGYPAAYQPNARGYDWFYGLLQGSRSYFPIDGVSAHQVFLENRTPTDEGGYTTDRIGDAAVRYINQQDGKSPFFLFVSFTAPHGPLQAKPEHLQQLQSIQPQQRRRYAALIMSLDENVGKILRAVEAQGIAENTLVIFTNDNGGQTQTGAINTPLRGRKGQLWEGGIRVPMAMQWKGKIQPNTVIDQPVTTLDFAATILALSGTAIDPDWKLDGINLSPALLQGSPLPERALYWRNLGSNGPVAIREGNWKLVHNRGAEQPGPFLFDLSQDSGESNDLSALRAGTVDALKAKLDAWEAELVEPLWGINNLP